MARQIATRYTLHGRLEAKSALHIGGLTAEFTDLAVALDGLGRPYLPGTSLAGPLRAWAQEMGNAEMVRYWWGDQQANVGHASHVIVENALLNLPDGSMLETRDGVGIDRHSATAADGVKFDRTVVPRGTTFDLQIIVDVPAQLAERRTKAEVREMLGMLVGALQRGYWRVGACKSRGMGRLGLADEAAPLTLTTCELGTASGMLQYLGINDGMTIERLDGSAQYADVIEIAIEWAPKGPLMVKAASDGLATDSLPLTGITGHRQRALLLPGSSVKGALRFQAERIMRTLLAPSVVMHQDDDFLEQIKLPVVDVLFGAAHVAKPKSPSSGPAIDSVEQYYSPLRSGLGCLFASDCYAGEAMDSDQWQLVFDAQDTGTLNKALNQLQNATTFQQAHHVAIDRWTAEPLDKALFTVLEPHALHWEPLRFSVNLSRLTRATDGNARDAVITLLLLVLRDFARGVIPLGFAVNRGLGDVEVTMVTLSGALCGTIDSAGIKLTSEGIARLESAWKTELARLHKKAQALAVPDALASAKEVASKDLVEVAR